MACLLLDPKTGRVLIELDVDDQGALTVVVADTGAWRPAPADPGHRGRRLQIIAALAEDVDLTHGPSGTDIRFRFAPASATAGASGTYGNNPVGLHFPGFRRWRRGRCRDAK